MIIQNTLWRTYLSNKSLPGAHRDKQIFCNESNNPTRRLPHFSYEMSAMDFFSSFNLMQHRAPKTNRNYNDGHILSRITLTSYN